MNTDSTPLQLSPMQMVIEKMTEAKDNFPSFGFDEEFVRGFNKAFQMAIFITQEVGLSKESSYLQQARAEAMFLNMQYYYEYCQSNGYVTPKEWIEKYKHF